jgi:hypothetical protein
VYENKTEQFVLEETREDGATKSKITVKLMRDTTKSLQLLRVIYTVVCVLWTGFFFVFGLQVLLFLVLDLAVQSGYTEIQEDASVGSMIGVILAIIGFVHGFSSAMVIAWTFCSDVWSGHYMAKQFFRLKCLQSETAVDWLFFTFFIALPALVLSGTWLSGTDNWWSISAIFYFSCVCIFFAAFACSTVFYEVLAAYNFVKNGLLEKGEEVPTFWIVVGKCILLKQKNRYSGKQKITYMARSSFDNMEATEMVDQAEIFPNTETFSLGMYDKFTAWSYISTETEHGPKLFKPLDPPKRLYTIDDVQDFRPFFTKRTWSLERVFCRPQDSRYVAIVSGPGALTRAQIRSSIACSAIGTFLIILLVVSLLVWLDIPALFIAIILFIMCVAVLFFTRNLRTFARVAKDLVDFRTALKEQQITFVEYWDKHVKPNLKLPAILKSDDPQEQGAVEVGEGDAPGEAQVEKPTDHETTDEEESPDVPALRSPGSMTKRQSIIDLTSSNEASEGVFLVVEYKRTSQVTARLCRLMTALEIGLWFLYPLISIFVVGNWQIALLFLLVAGVSNLRHYINARTVIEEIGNMVSSYHKTTAISVQALQR